MENNTENAVMEEKKTNKVAAFIGSAFAYVIGACVTAVTVALTVKFIMWLF